MEVIRIQPLIDITNSNIRRINQGSQQQLDQFRNWTTLLQSIGLRAVIDFDRDPTVETVDVKGLGFGTNYQGTHQVWTFDFRPDRATAFADKNDPVALLKIDLDKIPIILNLTETINTEQAVFELVDAKSKNTVVKAL